MEGGPGYDMKWTQNEIKIINRLLKSFNNLRPKELHRKVRGLDVIKFWKGTEFRSFLLYFGIVVLKTVLSEPEFELFLKLHIAVRICYTNQYMAYRGIAKQYFLQYIEGCINTYGIHSIQSNVHNLSHVFDDVSRFGCLNHISTYPFENRLYFIKHRLKQPNLPLQQISRRIIELSLDHDQLYSCHGNAQSNPMLKVPFNNTQSISSYKEVVINSGCTISSKRSGDSWFLANANDIVKMSHAEFVNNEIIVYGWPIVTKSNYFTRPVSSSRFHIYQSDGITSNSLATFNLKSIKAKFVCMPIDREFVFVPLLHTITSS